MKNTAITKGIRVTVEVFYQPLQSKPEEEQFIFAYQVAIENLSKRSVQLQRRQWFINDSNGEIRDVEGPGVVGETPTLHPGEAYGYQSWCPLRTAMGKMGGFFTMADLGSRERFEVQVPEFQMIAPFLLN